MKGKVTRKTHGPHCLKIFLNPLECIIDSYYKITETRDFDRLLFGYILLSHTSILFICIDESRNTNQDTFSRKTIQMHTGIL